MMKADQLSYEHQNIVKTHKEMENALDHLMVQFRQIETKYGLMVSEEINQLYAHQSKLINKSHNYTYQMNKQLCS